MADINLPQLEFGEDATTAVPHPGSFSTDQGNVTQVCPGFHPVYRINSENGAANHTKEFTAAAITEESYQLTLGSAKGMAATAWKMLSDADFAKGVWAEFENQQKARA